MLCCRCHSSLAAHFKLPQRVTGLWQHLSPTDGTPSRHPSYSKRLSTLDHSHGCYLDRRAQTQSSAVKRFLRVVRRCQLLDLPWEDVLVPHILCYLPLQHLVRLQRVSKQFHSLIQVYLANCRTFDPSSVSHNKQELF